MEAIAAIGNTVFVESDGKVIRVDNGKATALELTVDQWLRFNGAYAQDPTDEQAAAAVKVAKGDKSD